MPLPTGSVTFLFTDIEGSTALWERDREAMQTALALHDQLLREAIEGQGGHVFKTVGDAFCAVFASPVTSLAAALAAQRALRSADWSMLAAAGPLTVRMGLHSGAAEAQEGDYFGPDVNRVARIEAAGHGGQILLSGETRRRLESDLPAGCRLRDLGEHRLKDLRHSERLSQVVATGLPDVRKPLRTAEALSASDRIQVLSASARETEAAAIDLQRSLEDTLLAIESAVLQDGRAAVLSAEQVHAAAEHRPEDWREWRLGRIAEWSRPRYRLDHRFVGLSLLVDQGEEAIQGRWKVEAEHQRDLRALLASIREPAIVLLGPPGSGKSTLLRHLELYEAILGLRGESERVTFYLPLSSHVEEADDASIEPAAWLARCWAARYPAQPSLDRLLAEGRVTLLLDGLNELPVSDLAGFSQRLRSWKHWLQRLAQEQPGNRVIFSCRSLDYSQPLSTPGLRVPQVLVERLDDAQVRRFLQLYSPGRWREVWQALEGQPQLELLRSPYFLVLLIAQVEASGATPSGRAALFTGFVRQALRREVERGAAPFESGALLSKRDLRRIVKARWRDAFDLPERGLLLPKLAELAHAMQRSDGGGGSQVRLDVDAAMDLLDTDWDEAILAAGAALAVLDEDEAASELMYVHQLVQEYFAARKLSRRPEPERVRVAWRGAEVSPGLEATIEALDPADPLPGTAQTGWEESTLLALPMAEDPVGYLRDVMGSNLALAGRAAAQPELAPRLPQALLDALRSALLRRSRDPEADLRARIACALALGDLGDPRLEQRSGPEGPYLLPPMVQIAGGRYPIGADEPIEWSGGRSDAHCPRHAVAIAPFAIGRFPVTNAEWRGFMEAGGYEDLRWWDLPAARGWRAGRGTADGVRAGVRHWRELLRSDPEALLRFERSGTWNEDLVARWRQRLTMDDAAFEAHLAEQFPESRLTEPLRWGDERFNRDAQPVVGISWYEARAYTRWLAAQTGLPFRLPTELEWEAAARGKAGRRYAYGDAFDRLKANVTETHVRRTTPIGVFPEGDTPEGSYDLTGNTMDWTLSLFGPDFDKPDFGYPYRSDDGREDPAAVGRLQPVLRGGTFSSDATSSIAAGRGSLPPGVRGADNGLRLALSLDG